MMKTSLTNSEPLTWACECGQMNLLDEHECFACAGDMDECWDEHDKARAIWIGMRGGYKIVGFVEDRKP